MKMFDAFGLKSIFQAVAAFFLVSFLLFPADAQEKLSEVQDDIFIEQMTAPSNDAPEQYQESEAQTGIILSAKLTESSEPIKDGMIWRIYSSELGKNNKLALVAKSEEGTAYIDLKPGTYLLYGSFGRAQVMRRINLIKGQYLEETFVLDAGGLKLNATLIGGEINEKLLRFSIYLDDSESDEQALVIANVKPKELVRLKKGDYHIVSNYGSDNAVIRFNTHVESGRIIDISIQHQAAQITLKLVRQEGGEALADTSWSIANDSGDIVRESVGAYASLVLAEGDYVAIAKNKDQIYQKEFSVVTGQDRDIDVVADQRNQRNYDDSVD